MSRSTWERDRFAVKYRAEHGENGLGIGYQYDFDDLGMFVRAEVTASGYEDVKAINTNDITKQITIDNMYGAEGSIRVGKTF